MKKKKKLEYHNPIYCIRTIKKQQPLVTRKNIAKIILPWERAM